MKFAPCEIDRDAPLTWLERVVGAFSFIAPFVGIALVSILCGCKELDVGGETDEPTCNSAGADPSFPTINTWWK